MRLFLALLLCSCSQRTDLLARSDASAGCGAPIKLGSECAGAAAAKRLRYALCSCAPLVVRHNLVTERGSMDTPAAVGSDGHLQVYGSTQVSGAVEAAGLLGMGFNRAATVFGTLRSGGLLTAPDFLLVTGDAYVDDDVVGNIDIEGVLHVPMGAHISPQVRDMGEVYEQVEVTPPCNCGATPDLTALIAEKSKVNDNGSINLGPDALVGLKSTLDLPCGEYWLSQIKTADELELRVHGRAALYVSSDVYLVAGMRVVLDPMAELDLVVGGALTVEDGSAGAANADRVRLWVAGDSVFLGDYAQLSASVYAPNATVIASSRLDVNGALLAAEVQVPGDVHVHYASEILAAGTTCGEMPQPPVE